MKNTFSYSTLMMVVTFVALPFYAFATPQQQVPLDGGLSLLVVAGVGYGVKKFTASKKKKAKATDI